MSRSATYWQKRKLQRKRWSINAVRAKERLRLERLQSPQAAMPVGDAVKIRPRWDVKISIERKDGQRLQLSLVKLYGKLVGEGIDETPKQLGRRLGTMLDLAIH